MFKAHKDSMRMEPTPERVFSICKYVNEYPCGSNELGKVMSMFLSPGQGQNEIFSSVRVAEELDLVQTVDGKLTYVGEANILTGLPYFRRYVGSRSLSKKNTTFFKVTEWYLSKNEGVFQYANWQDKAAAIAQDGLEGISDNDFLGWRFWASFIGEGYLQGTSLLPNMKIRIQDVLVTHWSNTFGYNEAIPAKEFISWVQNKIPEVSYDGNSYLNLGFSAGLRTLHELKLITLISQMDASRWQMYPVEGKIIGDFSHIAVKEEIIHELG